MAQMAWFRRGLKPVVEAAARQSYCYQGVRNYSVFRSIYLANMSKGDSKEIRRGLRVMRRCGALSCRGGPYGRSEEGPIIQQKIKLEVNRPNTRNRTRLGCLAATWAMHAAEGKPKLH